MRKLTPTKGAMLPVVITSVLIAIAGFGFWALHGAGPNNSVATSELTATALPTATPTLASTPAPGPTPTPALAPTPTTRPTAAPQPAPTPRPTAVSAPQLTLDSYFIRETSCKSPFSPVAGITVTNTGGGTLTWQASININMVNPVDFSPSGGSLAAGKSQFMEMNWYAAGSGIGAIAPAGTVPITFTSNGGDATVSVECAPS